MHEYHAINPIIIKQYTASDSYRLIGNKSGIPIQINKSFGKIKQARFSSYNIWVTFQNGALQGSTPIAFFRNKLSRDLAYEILKAAQPGKMVILDWNTFFNRKRQASALNLDLTLFDLPDFGEGIHAFLNGGEVDLQMLKQFNAHPWVFQKLLPRHILELTQGIYPSDFNDHAFALTICLSLDYSEWRKIPTPMLVETLIKKHRRLLR